jgi:hypothetical protein
MSALWGINLVLVLNRLIINKEKTLINVLKALTSITSMCNPGVIFSSMITSRYFTSLRNGMFCPFNVK